VRGLGYRISMSLRVVYVKFRRSDQVWCTTIAIIEPQQRSGSYQRASQVHTLLTNIVHSVHTDSTFFCKRLINTINEECGSHEKDDRGVQALWILFQASARLFGAESPVITDPCSATLLFIEPDC
jgi:hypothetical protein